MYIYSVDMMECDEYQRLVYCDENPESCPTLWLLPSIMLMTCLCLCYPLFAHRGVCSCAHRAQMQRTRLLWGPIHSHSCFWFALHLSNGSDCNRCIKGPWYYFHVCMSMQLPGCSVSLFFFFLTRTESIAKRTKTVAHTWFDHLFFQANEQRQFFSHH